MMVVFFFFFFLAVVEVHGGDWVVVVEPGGLGLVSGKKAVFDLVDEEELVHHHIDRIHHRIHHRTYPNHYRTHCRHRLSEGRLLFAIWKKREVMESDWLGVALYESWICAGGRVWNISLPR